MLKPEQWKRLVERIGEIENPEVPTEPSEFSTPTKKRSSAAHKGE